MNRALRRHQQKLMKARNSKNGSSGNSHSQAMAQAANYYQGGNAFAAIAVCQSILDEAPDHAHANHLLGIIMLQQQSFKKAIEHLNRATAAMPEDAAMLTHLGTALSYAGKLDAAADSLKAALEIDPKFVDAHNNLAALSMRRNDPKSAIAHYQRALAVNERVAAVHANLANAFLSIARVDDAIAHYRRALSIRPRFPEAEYGLAQALRDNGDLTEAVEHYKIALEQNRTHASAMTSLAFVSDSLEDDMHARIRNTYKLAAPECDERKLLSFALGRHEENLGNFERAAELFTEGNAIHRATLDFSPEKSAQQIARISEVFNQDFFNTRVGSGVSTEAPIFIVGMPRSGTTLVEQILASHPEVTGGGELSQFPATVFPMMQELHSHGFPDAASLLQPDHVTQIARTYLGALDETITGTSRFTDKLPGNFLMVGLIKLAFPNARVVHCTRDARDTCLSMFKIFFPSGGHHFSYDLGELIDYHRHYQALMQHWKSLFGDDIIDANYETIVTDPETSIRTLLDECGLDFDQRCIDFHATKRVVRTASAVQVRKPIYTSSIGMWKNYAPYLPGLEAAS